MDENIAQVVLPLARRQAGGLVELLGTCFFVGNQRFATAAHVTGPSDEGLMLIGNRMRVLSDYQDTTDTRVNSIPLRIVAYNPVHDISILEFIDPQRWSAGYTLGGTDHIPTGSQVTSLGYPHADTGRFVLTTHTSQVGARILLGSAGVKTKHVVLNTQTRPGQSGGPVFSADGRFVHAMVLGGYTPSMGGSVIVGNIDPQTLHQTTHAVSAEYIKAML